MRKKILMSLGAVVISVASTAAVVSCSSDKDETKNKDNKPVLESNLIKEKISTIDIIEKDKLTANDEMSVKALVDWEPAHGTPEAISDEVAKPGGTIVGGLDGTFSWIVYTNGLKALDAAKATVQAFKQLTALAAWKTKNPDIEIDFGKATKPNEEFNHSRNHLVTRDELKLALNKVKNSLVDNAGIAVVVNQAIAIINSL